MLQGYSLIVPWVIFPYVLAAVMPTWRWLLVCALVAGCGLGYFWTEHWIATQQLGYKERIGDTIGIALFGVATLSFTCGVIVRAISLFAWARGHRKGAIWIVVFGAAVPFAVLTAPDLLRAWQQRPASAGCIERGFPIEIGSSRYNIPAAGFFVIYRGPSSARDASYMFSIPHLRDLCAQTADGSRRIHATNLAIRFDPIHQWKSKLCGAPPPWAGKLCAAVQPASVFTMDPTDYPLTAYVYSLPEVRLGEFLGSASTYQDLRGPPVAGRDDIYVTADVNTPDGKPLTFACRVQSDGSHWCTTSYPWLNGTHLHYAFRTHAESIAEKGQRIDQTLRTFLAQFQATEP